MRSMKDTTKTYFADTYALIELFKGNPSYQSYLNHFLITTQLNLAEVYYHLLRHHDQQIADPYLILCRYGTTQITLPSIQYGMRFKLQYKKENPSYIDCIGYALAVEIGIKFLTGDSKFKDKPNVEFVR